MLYDVSSYPVQKKILVLKGGKDERSHIVDTKRFFFATFLKITFGQTEMCLWARSVTLDAG